MDKIFSARLDEEAIHEMESVTRRLGLTKKRFLEEAIRLHARQIGAKTGIDVWSETAGAWKRREAPLRTVAKARSAFEHSFKRYRS